MKTKFKAGETALLNGKEVTIQTAKKHFPSQSISYRLQGEKENELGEVVPESALQKLTDKSGKNELIELHTTYEEKIGPVPNNKKNNVEWLKSKIAEAEQSGAKDKYTAISKLTQQQLVDLVAEKELEIDTEDYEDAAELLVAICEELEIPIPEEK